MRFSPLCRHTPTSALDNIGNLRALPARRDLNYVGGRLCAGEYLALAAVHSPSLDLGGIGVRVLAREAEGTVAFDGHCEIAGRLPLYPENCAASEQEDGGVGQRPHRYRQLHCRALWNRRGAGQEYSSDAYVFRLSAYLLVVQPD